jgi:succinate dehydrogenase hydrophobic anchor subunit
MANILVNVEKGIEVAAADVLKWLGKAHTAVNAAPAVVAALATLITQLEKPIMDISGVAANPLNIALDLQTATDLKAVWPEIKTFLGTLGVKF